ncbi:MarR family transcriptional regulator [Pseudooceanicola spongiae]|uniref:MarR family transcriptional regulator n=1 Tax=Pseudooceanicola spongiae TaxID=2613965 RepID=A0A7L9WQF8_9RHOB|nr:MarR family transcriptional regulator [Pseudooceanicola spongiae]QOL82499.1 MarR family transcriptional regulator [Pseudooceanicola spongiae]
MPKDPPPASLSPTGRSLPIALLRARERIIIPIRRMLAEAGVSEPQWRILRVLDEAGPMSGQDLARAACLQPASVSRLLQAMVQKGQIRRVQDMSNRRRQVVSICPAGSQILSDYSAVSRGITDQIRSRFGPDKYSQLLDLLDDLNSIEIGTGGIADP